MQRESIIRGPAAITFNSLTFYTAGDIVLTLEQQEFEVTTSIFGRLAPRGAGRLARVRFTPAGKYSGNYATLWPYAATAIGADVYGATDKNLVIMPFDTSQSMLTVYNAAITKMPSMTLSAVGTIMGEVEFTALGKENTLPSVADSLVKYETNTFADTSFADTDLITQPYSAAWGATLTGIDTSKGFVVDFGLELSPVISNTYGTVGMTLKDLSVTAKFEPLTITEAQALAAIGIDKAMGASLASANNLVITGTGVSVTLYKAILKQYAPVYGPEANRIGELVFHATRSFTSGRANALFAVA